MVEQYQERVRSRGVNQQDLSVRATPEAAGAGIGRAMQGVGQGVMDVGLFISARNELKAGNDARDAENRYIAATQQLRYNPETGYLNQTGANALDRRAAFEEQLAKTRSDIAATLSPQARRAFEASTDALTNGVREQFIRHEATQLREHTNSTRLATAEGYVNEALLNYNNPELFQQNLQRALDEQAQVARLNGTSPEAALLGQQKLVSSAYAGAIARMADEGVGGATRARAYMNENIERLTAEDRSKLDTVLRPLVLRDTARLRVNETVNRTGRPTSTYSERSDTSPAGFADRAGQISALLNDGYANETRRRESGSTQGRLDAAPPVNPATGRRASTARGPYQFIESTWLNMVERARRSGGAKWADGLSREEILEMRWTGGMMKGRDGDVQTANDEMFAQFRLYNREVLERGGFSPTPENEYLLHIFGEGGGMNVLRASPGAMMETIIGDEAARNNNLTGVTAGQYRRRLATAYGSPDAPQYSQGAEYDFAALYSEALAVMETDPELGAAMMQEVQNRQTAVNAARDAEQKSTFDEAWQAAMQSGNWELSPELAMRMGSSLADSFRVAGQNTLTGIQYTDPVVFSSLKDMATDPNTRDQFAALDLADFLGSKELSNNDYVTLRDLQSKIQEAGSPEGQQRALIEALGGVDPVQIWSDIKPIYENAVGYDADPSNPAKMDEEKRQQVARFRRAMEQAVVEAMQAKAAAGQPSALSPLELNALAYELLRPVEVQRESWSGLSWTEVPTFDKFHQQSARGTERPVVTEFDDIPANVAQAMGSFLEHIPPGPRRREEVQRLYNDAEIVRRGGTPTVTIEQVPDDIIVSRPNEGGFMSWVPRIGGMAPDGTGDDVYEIDIGGGETVEMTEGELLDFYAETRRKEVLYMLGELDQLEGN